MKKLFEFCPKMKAINITLWIVCGAFILSTTSADRKSDYEKCCPMTPDCRCSPAYPPVFDHPWKCVYGSLQLIDSRYIKNEEINQHNSNDTGTDDGSGNSGADCRASYDRRVAGTHREDGPHHLFAYSRRGRRDGCGYTRTRAPSTTRAPGGEWK